MSAPLLYAGVAKLLKPELFAQALPSFDLRIVPPTERIARLIGVVEVASGWWLLLRGDVLGVVSALLAYLITVAVMWRAVRAGASGDCGCFGAVPGRIDALAVVRNAAFVLASVALGSMRAVGLATPYELRSGLLSAVFLTLILASVEVALEVRGAARVASQTRR